MVTKAIKEVVKIFTGGVDGVTEGRSRMGRVTTTKVGVWQELSCDEVLLALRYEDLVFFSRRVREGKPLAVYGVLTAEQSQRRYSTSGPAPFKILGTFAPLPSAEHRALTLLCEDVSFRPDHLYTVDQDDNVAL